MSRAALPRVEIVGLLVALAVTGTGTAVTDRFEPNDEFDTAATIEPDEYPGLEIGSDDRDFFALDLDAGAEVAVSIEFAHAEGDLDMTVYGPNRNEIGASSSLSDGESVGFTAREAGTYYVEVYPFGFDTVSYDLDATGNDRFEPNDDFGSTAAIASGRYEDLLVIGGESDFYVADLAPDREVTISITFSHGIGDLELAIYGPDRSRLASNRSLSDDESITFTTRTDGDHYIEVYGFHNGSAPYDMTVRGAPAPTASATEPTGTPGQSTPTTDGKCDGNGDADGGDGVSMPGFGLVVAVVAIGTLIGGRGIRHG